MSSRSLLASCLLLIAGVALQPSSLLAQVDWVREGEGPVLEPGAPGSWEGYLVGPAFVLHDVSELKLWYVGISGRLPSDAKTGLATSSDGLEWEKEASNPVLPGMPGTWQAQVIAGSVLRGSDGGYTMWYGGLRSDENAGSIGRATSADGVTWIFADTPILAPAAAWEGPMVEAPRVLFDGSTYHMWYMGLGPLPSLFSPGIGYATSVDGNVWKKYAGNPVITAATDNSHGAFAPSVSFDARTGTYEMWYSSARTSQPVDGWAIGYATSADGVTWCPHGPPVLEPGSGWDGGATINPSVLFDGRIYRMWYNGGVGPAPQAGAAIGLATAEWTIPKASFTAAAGAEELTVEFDASRSLSPSGAITGHLWDFGDGSPPASTGASPLASHRYARPGHYPVKLTATDGAGKRGSVARGANARLGCADVSPWLSADIGEPLYPGSACLEDGGTAGEGAGDVLRIAAGGRLLAGTSDELYFVYQPLAGDGAVMARIAEAGGAGDSFQVGVMIREGLDAGAWQLAAVLHKTPAASRLRAFRRTRSLGGTLSDAGEATEAPNAWVRVERAGDELIASVSRLGADGPWVELRRVRPEGLGTKGEVLAGIVVLGRDQRSGSDGGRFDALLARVSGASVIPGEPKKPALGPFLRGDCNGDGQVAGSVTDAVFLLNHNFSGGSAPPCLAACDANGDGQVTGQVTDAVFLLQFNFLGGPAPPAPFPECAASRRSEDERLGCAEPPAGCR
jgi:hypothetical protein